MLWRHFNISKVKTLLLNFRNCKIMGGFRALLFDPHEPEYNGEFCRVCAGEYNESCFEGIAIRCFYILLTYYILLSY